MRILSAHTHTHTHTCWSSAGGVLYCLHQLCIRPAAAYSRCSKSCLVFCKSLSVQENHELKMWQFDSQCVSNSLLTNIDAALCQSLFLSCFLFCQFISGFCSCSKLHLSACLWLGKHCHGSLDVRTCVSIKKLNNTEKRKKKDSHWQSKYFSCLILFKYYALLAITVFHRSYISLLFWI